MLAELENTVFMMDRPLLASFFLRSVPFSVDVTDSVKLDNVLGSLKAGERGLLWETSLAGGTRYGQSKMNQ